MSSKNKSRSRSSVRRSLRTNACKRITVPASSPDGGLDLGTIYSSHDPELAAYFSQAVEREFEAMSSQPSPKQFGLALERVSLQVAHQFAHLFPADQQALLARMSVASPSAFSPTAA